MRAYRLNHLSDEDLMRGLAIHATEAAAATTTMIALIAEVDRRRLYESEGYTSLYDYCVKKLGLSEDEAEEYVRAARAPSPPGE